MAAASLSGSGIRNIYVSDVVGNIIKVRPSEDTDSGLPVTEYPVCSWKSIPYTCLNTWSRPTK